MRSPVVAPLRARLPALLPVLAVDVVAVLLFTAVGRRSHDESAATLAGTLGGLAHTAWPFLVALALGWALVVARGWRPGRVRPAGLAVWAVTVLGGHALRLVSGQGSAVSFLVVTAVVLGVLLLGWRAGWRALQRAGRSPHGPRGQH